MPCYCRETGNEYAVKIVKSHININEEVRMLNECQGHPNILELRELLKDEKYIYIVTELIDGTELHDYKGVSVDDAKHLFNQLADAIHFMHSKNIVHRDIKFENILVSNSHPKTLTIIDFGFATRQCDNTLLTKTCFTLDYVPPEILANVPYTRKCDIWSLGVTLYLLLCGDTPFGSDGSNDSSSSTTDKNISETTSKIETGSFNHSYSWSKISSSGKDLIRRMLVVNPDDRLKIEDVINHDWLANYRKYHLTSTLTCSSYNTSTSTKALFNTKMNDLSNAFDNVLLKINRKNQIESNQYVEEIINNNYKEDANNFSLIISDDDDDDTNTVIFNDSIVSELWDEDFYGFDDSDDFYGFAINEIKTENKLQDLITKLSKPMYTTSMIDEIKPIEQIKETKKKLIVEPRARTTRKVAMPKAMPIVVETKVRTTRQSLQEVKVKAKARAPRKSTVTPKLTTEVVKRNTRGRKIIETTIPPIVIIPVEIVTPVQQVIEKIVEKPKEEIIELRRTGRIKKQVVTISPDDFLSWNDEGDITFDSIKTKEDVVQPGRIRRSAKRRNEIDDRDWLTSTSKPKRKK